MPFPRLLPWVLGVILLVRSGTSTAHDAAQQQQQQATPTGPIRKLLQQSRLEAAGVLLDPRPPSKPSQLATFRSCLDNFASNKGLATPGTGAGARSTVTEAGRRNADADGGAARPSGKLSVMLAADGTGSSSYKTMMSLNAQTRGAKLQPLAFAQPASDGDVAALVRCAGDAGLRFAARNGGHSYEAQSMLDGGIVIDLRAMKDIRIDARAGTVVLGAGQKLGSVYAALSRAGYTLPTGTCVGVGISGFTLGGGLGHATRALGTMADSVIAATVVLPNGTLVTADKDRHPDLFWAIRGGGPLYGLVTSWTVKLHKAPAKATLVKYKFSENCTESKWAEVLNAWNEWKPWTLGKEVALADIECGFGHLWVQIWVWGSMDEAMKIAKASPVFRLSGTYSDARTGEYTWPDFVVRILTNLHDSAAWSWDDLWVSSTAQDQGSFVAGSLMPKGPLSLDAVKALAKATAEVQDHAFVQARAWGGALEEFPRDFNAFPWRGRVMEFQVYSAGGTAKDRDWVDSTLATMRPLINAEGELYNYFHCVKDPWRTFFGPHADRLKQIKATYDPDNRLGGLYCQRGVVL